MDYEQQLTIQVTACLFVFNDKDQLVRKFGSNGSNNGRSSILMGLHLIIIITCMLLTKETIGCRNLIAVVTFTAV